MQKCIEALRLGWTYPVSLALYRAYYGVFFWKRRVHLGLPVDVRGPCIVIANHMSDEDPWTVSNLLPLFRPIHWLSKKELYDMQARFRVYAKRFPRPIAYAIAWIGVRIVAHAFTIPIDRDDGEREMNRAAMVEMRRVLKAGGVVGIFPEGGIGRTGKAHKVFIKLAEQCRTVSGERVSIYPVRIDQRTVTIGRRITPSDLTELRQKMSREKAAIHVMESVYQLGIKTHRSILGEYSRR